MRPYPGLPSFVVVSFQKKSKLFLDSSSRSASVSLSNVGPFFEVLNQPRLLPTINPAPSATITITAITANLRRFIQYTTPLNILLPMETLFSCNTRSVYTFYEPTLCNEVDNQQWQNG